MHRMAAYCSTAERCAADVEMKIGKAGFTRDASERIIGRLKEEKFIDEDRFAKSFVNDKLLFNKWGRVKIDYELGKKKISAGCRARAMEIIDEGVYQANLQSVLKEKIKTIKTNDGNELFAKLLRFAVGRGYEGKEIIACLRQILNNTTDAEYTE